MNQEAEGLGENLCINIVQSPSNSDNKEGLKEKN
jgi:hypothetical protein